MKSFFHIAALSALAVLAAVPALAQGQTAGRSGQATGSCGQTVALTYTLSLPIDASPVEPLALNINRGEPLYLEFQVGSDTRLVARTTTGDAASDPYLTIYSSAGYVIVADDDSAGGYDSMVDTTLSAGTYCAQVRPVSGSTEAAIITTLALATGDAAQALADTATASGGDYTGVDYTLLCTDPSLTADLGTIAAGFGTKSFPVTVAPGARQDWRFTISGDVPLQFDSTSVEFDTLLTLVDANNQYVMENDDGPSGTDSQLLSRLPEGSYCLSLSAYDGGSGAATLAVTDNVANPPAGPIGTACTDPGLTQDFGTPIAPGIGTQSRPFNIATNSRNDFRIEVTGQVLVQIDAKSPILDTVLTIVDAAGNVVEENDDGPVSTDSRISRTLATGSYCLAVAGYGGESGQGELVISDSPEADPVAVSGTPGCADPALTADLGTPIGPDSSALTLPVTIASNSRQDWRMEVTGDVTLTLDATSSAFDTLLKVSDGAGNLIEENDDMTGGTGTNSRITRSFAAGSYCISLEGFAGSSGPAQLVVAPSDGASPGTTTSGGAVEVPDASLITDLGALATVLQSSAMSPEETRWLAFTLDAAAPVRVDAVSASGGFTLRLLRETGEVVTEAQGASGLTPTSLNASLEPGRYLVAMQMAPGVTARLRNIVVTRQ